MDTGTLLFGLMTLTFVGVTHHAWRLGNDRRDVVLLGSIGALCGVGAVVTAVL
ncbi:hypothetical protein ACWA7J_15200 [Leptothrix sp. BB-4]